METSRLLEIIARRKWAILLAAAACSLLAAAASLRAGELYTASITLKVRPNEVLAPVGELLLAGGAEPREPLTPEADQAQTRAVVQTLTAVVKSPAVLAPVASRLAGRPRLNVPQLQSRIEVRELSPVLLQLSVSDPSPRRAEQLANEVAASFRDYFARLRAEEARRDLAAVQQQIDTARKEIGRLRASETRDAGLRAALTEENYRALLARQQQLRGAEALLLQGGAAAVVDPAGPQNPAANASGGQRARLALAGLLLGGLAALTLFVLAEAFDRRLRRVADVQALMRQPVIALVPRAPAGWAPRAVARAAEQHPGSPFARAFQLLALCVLRGVPGRARGTTVVAGLSARASQGATTALTNLAIALAQMGRRVILVDGDLRRPSLHSCFDLPPAPGLAEVARGSPRPEEALRATGILNLALVSAGAGAANSWAAVHTAETARFLEALREKAEFIVVNTPPAGEAADAFALAAFADVSLLVVRAGETATPAEALLREGIRESALPVLGVVLNDVPRAEIADLQRSIPDLGGDRPEVTRGGPSAQFLAAGE